MSEYYYLVASLPMLTLEAVPEISSDEFLAAISEHLSSFELSALETLSLLPSIGESRIESVQAWNEWETSVRNTIVGLRAKGDVSKSDNFKRSDCGFFSEIDKGVVEAFAKSNPLEREKHLERIRWAFLDDLELGHDFDIVKLAAYRLKLMLCEKRSSVSVEKGAANYDAIIASVYVEASIGS